MTVVGTFLDAPVNVVSGITDLELRMDGAALTLYAAGRAGGGLLSLDVTTGITLRDHVALPAGGGVGAPSRLGLVDLAAGPALMLTGAAGGLVGGYRIEADGSLGAATSLSGSPAGSVTAQTVTSFGGAQYIYLAPAGTNAIVVGQIAPTGVMTTLQSVSLGASVAGRDVSAMTSVTVGGQRMLVATSAARNEIDIYAVGGDGRLTQLSTFGVIEGLWTAQPGALSAVVVDGATYLVLGASGSSSLTVLRLDGAGALTVVDHVIDTLDTRFDGVEAVATVMVAGRAYVLGGGADDGVNLFTLMPDGRLVLVGTVLNAPGLGMTNVTAIAARASGTGLDVFVAGEGAGITRLRVELGALAAPQTGTAGADDLVGSTAGDQLYGGDGNDLLGGGAGRDILSDGAGADTLTGGADADVFVMSADGATDTIMDFQLGLDRIDLSEWGRVYDVSGLAWLARANGFAVSFGAEVLEVRTANGAALTAVNFVTADFFGLWHLTGAIPVGYAPPPVNAGDEVFRPSHASETLDGGQGYDIVDYSSSFSGMTIDMLIPGASTGLAAGDVFIGIEELRGGDFADVMSGTNGAEIIIGNDGSDIIAGRDGNDSLYGGVGDDLLRAGIGATLFDGGLGWDMVDYSGATGALLVDLFVGQGGAAAAGDRYLSIEYVQGGAYGDTLLGDAGRDILLGGAGNDLLFGQGDSDSLHGEDGNDTLQSGAFGDALFGGAGFDTADYGRAAQGVVLNLRDAVQSTGHATGDSFAGIEAYMGSAFGDTLLGSFGAEQLSGAAGDDLLFGQGGHDVLYGDDGNDTLQSGEYSEAFFGGAGWDVVDYGRATWAVTVDVAVPAMNTGNAVGDMFTGIEAFSGSGFNDTMLGGAVADHLMGQGGDDSLVGGAGNDTIWAGDGNDALNGGTEADVLDGGGGFDTLSFTGASAVIVDLLTPGNNRGDAMGDVILQIEGLSGSAFADGFYGDAAANQLQGNGGNDALVGRGGNDTLLGNAGDDFINGGAGLDQLYGGAGADRFVFGKGDGSDLIYDLALAQGDKLQLSGNLFATAQTPTGIVQRYGSLSGGMAALDFGGGDRITLVGVSTHDGLWQAIQII